MNNIASTTLIAWETRNWRHHKKASTICKDFGLQPFTKQFFGGKLYARERENLKDMLDTVFQKKTEKFFIATLCQSCLSDFGGTSVKGIVPTITTLPMFELIQMDKKA